MQLTTLIKWNSPSFPPGYCFTDFNALFSDANAFGSFTLNTDVGNSFFNYGETIPDAANRIFPWLRTVGGYPDDWYIFVGGKWYSLYKGAPAGPNGLRYDYCDTQTSLLTFDGGESAVVGIGSGPFWEVDTAFAGRTAVAPGALPSGASVALNDTGGTDLLTLASANIPPHRHYITTGDGNSDLIEPIESGAFRVAGGNQLVFQSTWTGSYVGYTRETGSSAPAIPVTNMQPYLVCYKIKRTGRKYRRVDP